MGKTANHVNHVLDAGIHLMEAQRMMAGGIIASGTAVPLILFLTAFVMMVHSL